MCVFEYNFTVRLPPRHTYHAYELTPWIVWIGIYISLPIWNSKYSAHIRNTIRDILVEHDRERERNDVYASVWVRFWVLFLAHHPLAYLLDGFGRIGFFPSLHCLVLSLSRAAILVAVAVVVVVIGFVVTDVTNNVSAFLTTDSIFVFLHIAVAIVLFLSAVLFYFGYMQWHIKIQANKHKVLLENRIAVRGDYFFLPSCEARCYMVASICIWFSLYFFRSHISYIER